MKHNAGRIKYYSKGFTIIEMLVAFTVVLIMLSGLSFILANSHKTSQIQSGLQSLQENGRFAVEQISRDARVAGYRGCSGGGARSGAGVPAAVAGFENTAEKWYPSGGTLPDPEAPADRDAFTVTYAVELMNRIAQTTGVPGSITLDSVAGIEDGDFIYLSNCRGADLIEVSTVNENKTTVAYTGTLGTVYYPGDNLLRLETVRYHIKGDPNNKDENDNPIPTLYRAANTAGDGDPFVAGVDNMQVLYGEDTTGSSAADSYRRADGVTDWDKVRSMRVALLLRTEREYGAGVDRKEGDINVLDHVFKDDGTRVRRRVFTTTINFRNGY